MLVVKRPFKNYGKVYTAGTVITEPADIKRLKGKIAEGKIIEVTEQTFESTANYFKSKFGVDISTNEPVTVKEVTEEKEVEQTSKPKTVAKTATKVAAK